MAVGCGWWRLLVVHGLWSMACTACVMIVNSSTTASYMSRAGACTSSRDDRTSVTVRGCRKLAHHLNMNLQSFEMELMLLTRVQAWCLQPTSTILSSRNRHHNPLLRRPIGVDVCRHPCSSCAFLGGGTADQDAIWIRQSPWRCSGEELKIARIQKEWSSMPALTTRSKASALAQSASHDNLSNWHTLPRCVPRFR